MAGLKKWFDQKWVDIGSKKKDGSFSKYEAQILEADATLKIYLDHSVGIGEHPQHIEEIDKLVDKIAQAEEKIKVLQQFKL